MKRHVLIATVGSFGDLHPYLAVALGLRERGHEVTFATSVLYREKVQGEGLRYVEIPPPLADLEHNEEARRRSMHPLDGTRYVVQEIFLPPLEEQYRILLECAREADVMFGSAFALGLPMAAAKLGKPYVASALQPAAMLSAYDPPLVPPMPFLPWLAERFGPKPVKVLFDGMHRMNRWLMRGAYELARREGLAESAVPKLFQDHSPHGNLLLFSKHFMAPQPDFPEPYTMCGFPFYDQLDAHSDGLPAELEAFLHAGEPPVVFTLGTSAVLDPGPFYTEAAKAISQAGLRAVFLVGRTNHAQYAKYHSSRIFVAEYAQHSLLMPRAAANVHQGGIGTTAQALRAGRPMITVPYSHDQPDNGRRCEKLGVGRVIARKHFNASVLYDALGTLQELEPAAERLAKLIGAEDAVGQACAKIAETQASPRTI